MLVGAQGSEVQTSRVVWPLAGVSAVQKKTRKTANWAQLRKVAGKDPLER